MHAVGTITKKSPLRLMETMIARRRRKWGAGEWGETQASKRLKVLTSRRTEALAKSRSLALLGMTERAKEPAGRQRYEEAGEKVDLSRSSG